MKRFIVLLLIVLFVCVGCNDDDDDDHVKKDDDKECVECGPDPDYVINAYIGDSHVEHGGKNLPYRAGWEGSNFGMSGAQIQDMSTNVADYGYPDDIYILVGFNNVWNGEPMGTLRSRMEGLLDAFSDTITLHVMSIIILNYEDVNTNYGKSYAWINDFNTDVNTFNGHIEDMCIARGIEFIDITSAIRVPHPNGWEMNSDYSSNGAHLNDAGYAAVYDVLYN